MLLFLTHVVTNLPFQLLTLLKFLGRLDTLVNNASI